MKFNIVPPRTPWILPDGQPTKEFYKFILNLLNAAGGGDQTQEDVERMLLDYSAPRGPDERAVVEARMQIGLGDPQVGRTADVERRLQSVEKSVSEQPPSAGRVAELERRMQLLESLLAEAARPRSDLTTLQAQIDVATAFSAGHH